jgi:hypothetical protein
MTMETNVIVDEARQRAEAVHAQRQAEQAQAVEAARDTIGRSRYEAAKARLPQLDQAIRTRWRPMLARVVSVATIAGRPLPSQPQQWCTELALLCDRMPQELQHGLQGFEALTYRALVDPRTPAGELIGGIKTLLQGSDGALHAGNQRWQQLEEFLETWPAAQPVNT